MARETPGNDVIAEALERVADLLELEGENPFRVRGYRRGARAVRSADRPLAEVLREERAQALTQMPGVGEKLAGAIREIVETGRLGLLERLESEVSPEEVLRRVPGIGEELAERAHRQLGVESLEELELAAHDGRLEQIEGIGGKRLEGIRNALEGMLSRSATRRGRRRREAARGTEERQEPPVGLLLEVDAEYRRKAEAGELRTIAPRRFNPEGKAWLPIMETEREGWHFTVLYSNTARAHELGKTRDWVVIYYGADSEEGQCTVVTAGSGPLRGRRVVRGREGECREHYG